VFVLYPFFLWIVVVSDLSSSMSSSLDLMCNDCQLGNGCDLIFMGILYHPTVQSLHFYLLQ
jgi:hypothetical protein